MAVRNILTGPWNWNAKWNPTIVYFLGPGGVGLRVPLFCSILLLPLLPRKSSFPCIKNSHILDIQNNSKQQFSSFSFFCQYSNSLYPHVNNSPMGKVASYNITFSLTEQYIFANINYNHLTVKMNGKFPESPCSQVVCNCVELEINQRK